MVPRSGPVNRAPRKRPTAAGADMVAIRPVPSDGREAAQKARCHDRLRFLRPGRSVSTGDPGLVARHPRERHPDGRN